MENANVADIDFNLAVKLLVQAHERAISQLQKLGPVENLALSSDKTQGETTSTYALPQPRSSAPAPMSLAIPSLLPSVSLPSEFKAKAVDCESKGLTKESLSLCSSLLLPGARVDEHLPAVAAIDNHSVSKETTSDFEVLVMQPEDMGEVKDTCSKTDTTPRNSKVHHNKQLARNPIFVRCEKSVGRTSTERTSVVFTENGKSTLWNALHPDSNRRLFWDSLSILVVLWDMIFVPYFTAWSVGNVFVLERAGAYAVSIFWTLDILINLSSGYYNEAAEVERRLFKSALRYLKTWFCLDVTLAIVDWIPIALDLEMATWALKAQQIGKVCKLMVRVPSKIPRGRDLYARVLLRINNKNYHSILEILRLVFLLILFNHILACLWYTIGQNPFMCGVDGKLDTCEGTWLTQPGMQTRTDLYHYLSALHWSVTQMTPASMEVVPENAGERLVTIFIILSGLLLGTSLIATMTSILTEIRVGLDAKLKKTLQLQKFLKQEEVPKELAMAVMRQVKLRLEQKTKLKTSEVAYINLLSHSLQADLKREIHMKHMGHHSFFGAADSINRDYASALCNKVKVASLSKDDCLFEEMHPGSHMYFITLGAAEYIPGLDAFEYNKGNAKIEATAWCSEPALWLAGWIHLGTCVIVSNTSEALSLDAEALTMSARKDRDFRYIIDKYSQSFEDYFKQAPLISDCSSACDPADVFNCLEKSDRMIFADGMLEHLREKASKSQLKKLGLLRDEIEAGKCSIAIVPGHGVMRTVSLAALRVTMPCAESFCDDSLLREVSDVAETIPSVSTSETSLRSSNLTYPSLCQVAEYDKKTQSYRAKCSIPGSKRRPFESAIGALTRLLSDELNQIAKAGLQIDYKSCEDQSFSEQSVTFGLHTRYIKTVFNGTLSLEGASMLPTITAAARDSWTAKEASLKAAEEAMAEKGWLHVWKREQQSNEWLQKAMQAEDLLKKFDKIMSLNNGNSLYLWLTPQDIEVLKQKEAAEVLKRWIELYANGVKAL